MSRMKKAVFYTMTICLGLGLSLLAGELLVRLLSPQPYMFPRFRFSEQYGALLYENTAMIDAWPGRYEYVYTINEFGFRGRAVPVSTQYDRTNILVLGDSNGFGKGVSDGEEFPAVLQRALEPDCTVVNLSVIGFGLTQQIRALYEYGFRYQPRTVILQFCSNDPSDNMENRVTELEQGRFVFKNTNNARAMQARTINSRSFIQKSQLYNFIRFRVLLPAYVAVHSGFGALARLHGDAQDAADDRLPEPPEASKEAEQAFYNELLRALAGVLDERGIRFIMISVNGQLERFPAILAQVHALERQGLLEYHDVEPWFAGLSGYESPEGHLWGTTGHRIVGEQLARVLREGRGSGAGRVLAGVPPG